MLSGARRRSRSRATSSAGRTTATAPCTSAGSPLLAFAPDARRQTHLHAQPALAAGATAGPTRRGRRPRRARSTGPPLRPDRRPAPRPRRWKGSSSAAVASPGTLGPLFSTRTSRSASRGSHLDLHEAPSRLWITAFSTRFHTSCSSSRRSPLTTAGVALSPTDSPRAAARPAARVGRRPRQLGQVHALVPLHHAGLAARERQQAVDQRLAPQHLLAHDVRGAPELVAARVRVGQRHLELGAHHGQRRAQLVRGVRHESPLARERRLEAVEHVVEGLGELAQLVVRAACGDAPVERVPAHGAGRGHDVAQRSQHAPGGQPAEQERQGGHRRAAPARTAPGSRRARRPRPPPRACGGGGRRAACSSRPAAGRPPPGTGSCRAPRAAA